MPVVTLNVSSLIYKTTSLGIKQQFNVEINCTDIFRYYLGKLFYMIWHSHLKKHVHENTNCDLEQQLHDGLNVTNVGGTFCVCVRGGGGICVI